MNQLIANQIAQNFTNISSVNCHATYMAKGETHQPTTLPDDKQGVYIFSTDTHCLKVGKAGANSQARWNSHHYLDNSTSSSLAKSILSDKERFKLLFPIKRYPEILGLNSGTIQNWIKNNTSRVELIMDKNEPNHSLNLLESLAQFNLKPEYEGNKA